MGDKYPQRWNTVAKYETYTQHRTGDKRTAGPPVSVLGSESLKHESSQVRNRQNFSAKRKALQNFGLYRSK